MMNVNSSEMNNHIGVALTANFAMRLLTGRSGRIACNKIMAQLITSALKFDITYQTNLLHIAKARVNSF